MFESWEIQAGRFDLALDEAVDRGIRVAGTNERHPWSMSSPIWAPWR